MGGIELSVAGWMAPAAIRMVVQNTRSYLTSNYNQYQKMEEMLDNLENALPRIRFAIKAAERRPFQSDQDISQWLKKLKLAVSKAEDVLDDFEAEESRERLKGKGKGKVSEFASSSVKTLKTVIFQDKDLKRLEKAVGRLQLVCSGVGDFLKMVELIDKNAAEGSKSTDKKETTSWLPKNMKILGRDKEIELILNIILGYDPFYDGKDNYKPKPEGKNGENGSIFPGLDIIPRFGSKVLNIVMRREKTPCQPSTQPQYYVECSTGKTQLSKLQPREFRKSGKLQSYEKELETMVGTALRWKINVNAWSLGVLPIVGISGVGKTTLAQIIYNNHIVKQQFSLQAWVYVSDNCDAKKLMQDIIFSFKLGKCSLDPESSLDIVQHELVNIIKNEMFFLVLDDVWDAGILDSTWNKILLSVLREGAPGSVVLVTTQLQIVADRMRTLPPIKLDVLPWKYFWQLFEYRAFGYSKFGDEDVNTFLPSKEQEITELKLIGKQIAEKLHGIPLEAEIIGYLLNNNLDKEHWRKISESGWWNARSASNMYTSLGVGYQNLNPSLKQSFLYCSIFPKGYVFQKDRLVQMWISHGFIHPTKMEKIQLEKGEKRLEDIGNERFEMLVDRFFFQPTVLENSYVMHDLIRDLAVVISSDEFVIINNNLEPIPAFACHLSLNNDHLVTELKDSNYETLRTLMLFSYFKEPIGKALATIFKKSSSLRLLDLSYMNMGTNGFPDVFSQLSHLRFLDLSFTGINLLPETISILCHLQVLDIRGCEFKKLPKGVNKLINLRHLYASASTISLISGIGKLINLQELNQFSVKPKEGHKVNELRNLNEIRGRLCISNLEHEDIEKVMMEANLVEKKHLNCLELFWNRCDPKQNYMATVERLQPPTNLIELKTINYPCTHFPNWMVEDRIVRKFRRVHIENSPLVVLPPLGHLPFLEILILKNLKSIKKINYDFYGSNSEVIFPSLKELVLCHLDEWEEWCGSKGMQTFPHLRKLHLECCPKLKDVPVDSFNNSVVELYIVSCAEIFKKSETILKQMTALTHLTIRAALGSPRVASRCFEYLRSLEALYLENAEIDMVEGMEHLKMLKKLQLSRVTFTLLQTEQSNNEIHQNQETGLKLLTYLGLQCMDSQKLLTLGRLSSLRTLLIYHSFTEEFVLGQIPWFAQQTSIEELEFVYCNDLICIPSIISTLVSLKKLTIRSCRYIKAITNPLPQNLKELHIINCSRNLMERCLPEMGKDWPNISHIPCIRVVKTTDQSRMPQLH